MTAPVFPFAQRDLAAELFILGAWTDITNDVRLADNVTIKRGADNEASTAAPSSCTMRLDNRTGKYSPRNPVGPYYGWLGRNTPLRVAIRTAKDAFGRTVSGGLGSADVGGAYSTSGAGGTVQASDYNVAAGVATLNLPVANSYRFAYLAGQLYRGDVEVAATTSVGFTDVTGGSINIAEILLGGLSVVDYFYVTVKISTAEALTMSIQHADGNVVVGDTAVSGLAFTGQALRVRAHIDGQTIRGKVWAPAVTGEPSGWNVEGRTDRLFNRAAGWVGLSASTSVGNTNVPVVVSYDNLEVRSNRFVGEVSSFPPEWDVSGRNVYTPIVAGGLRRRLGQGQTPLKSTYLRGNQTITPAHVGYWAVEDGTTATSIASGLTGGGAMTLSGGATQFAADSTFAGSLPIAKPNGGRWTSPTIAAAATGQIQLMFLLSVPSAGETDGDTFAQIQMSGTAGFLDVVYVAAGGGGLLYKFYDQTRTLIHTSGTLALTLNARPVMVSVELTQSGGDISYVAATLDTNGGGLVTVPGTVTGATIGAPRAVLISPYAQIDASAMGHVAIRNSITSIFTLANQMVAFAGETAGSRIGRLCTENGIASRYMWNGQIGSAAMGPQGRATLTDLLAECEAADMGSLQESRSILGLVYRFRASRYNQNAALALTYTTAGHVSPPLKPIEDDRFIRNDVTVSRPGGTSYEAIQTTGRLAVTSPTTGAGVGRYDDAVTLNLALDTQVPDAAAWRRRLGTVDEPRYSTIKVDLAALAKVDQQKALDALSVTVDDRITVASPPAGISPDQISQLAVGYTENINAFTHDIVFNCAPESPYELVSLDTAGQAKVDSGDSQLYSPAGATDTVLIVGSPTGERWTTAGGQMPIPLRLGGETVSATAVAALGPAFVAVGVASEGSNAPRTPALPAGVQAGDLLLCLAAIRNQGTGTVDTPAGYTLLADGQNFRLFGKPHSGTESAPTVTFTGGVANATCHAQMAALRGVSMSVLAAAGQLNGSAQNIAYPALTVPSGNGVVLYLGWKQDDWTSVATIAGATEIAEVSTTTGDDAGFVWDYVIQGATPANIGAGSFTVTGGASAISIGMTIALDGACQAMTVTRSTNGVVKAQANRTPIALSRPAFIGL